MVTPNALGTQARFRSRLASWAIPIAHKRFAGGDWNRRSPEPPVSGLLSWRLRTGLIAEFRDERHTFQRYEGSGMDDLDVQVQGTSISVTGTDFAVMYEKHPDLRILVVTQSRVGRSTLPDFTAERFRPRSPRRRNLAGSLEAAKARLMGCQD